MKYSDVKRKLKNDGKLTFDEIKEWVIYVSQPNSYRDFFNGKHNLRQLLINNFGDVVSSLSSEELVLLKTYLYSMPILAHKGNQILMRRLEEQVDNEQYIDKSLLRECLFIAYYKDEEREPIEDANNMSQYFENNFVRVLKKNLYPNFSEAYGVILSEAIQERKEFRDYILQILKENVKQYGKNLYTRDFRWFTVNISEFDPNYLIERSTDFIDILPPTEIDSYLRLLGKGSNIEKSSKVLSENASLFLQQTPTPLSTWKKIKTLNASFGDKGTIDKEKLGKIINIHSIVDEISDGRLNEKIKEVLVMLITDIADSEDCKISDMEKIGRGGFVTTYKLGNKVFKIGEKPYKYRIPKNHRRFLQPLIRSEQILKRKFIF